MDTAIITLGMLLLLAVIQAVRSKLCLKEGLHAEAVWRAAAAGLVLGVTISLTVQFYF